MSVLANLRRRVRICFAWQQMKAEWFVTAISDYLYVAVGVHSTLQCPEETGAESKVSAHKGHPAWLMVRMGAHQNWTDSDEPKLSE